MKALLTASLLCHTSLLKVQRLPSQGKHFDACEPLAQKMIVRSFVDYMYYSNQDCKDILYWSSQVLHEPPFDQFLSKFNRPDSFKASDDFLTKWRCLRYVAPPLLQFIFYFRWLFIGPAGSYSRLHVDPAGSAAWNACLEGSKRFVFFEPSVMHDLHEDLSPASRRHLFPDYILNPEVIRHKRFEMIAHPDDVVYAPPRWPHFVENLEASVSVTENFVRRHPDQFQYFDEALGSAERIADVETSVSCPAIPAHEIGRLKRFRCLVGLVFSIDHALCQ